MGNCEPGDIIVPKGGLESLVKRLNGSVRCDDIVGAIVQACKADVNMVSARLAVSHDKCTGDIRFAASPEALPFPDGRRGNSLVVVHECSILHIPMIIGTDMNIDTVAELCQFLVRKGCDVNSSASQGICVGENGGTFGTVCECSDKTPIFYAIEKKWARIVQVLIDLGADCCAGMSSAYSYIEKTTPLVYAMEEVLKRYRFGDGSFRAIDLLLGKVGIDEFIREIRDSGHIMNTALLFVTLVGLDLELCPGACIEAVKGEHMHVIEFFLKCSRQFKDEILDIKRTAKYRRMRESAMENKKAFSDIAAPSSVRSSESGTLSYRRIRSASDLNFPAPNNGIVFSVHIEDAEMSILALAAYHGKENAIRWMLENEIIDVNRCNGYGFSAVHYAAAENHVGIVKLLMDAGATATSKYMPYMTIAHTAALNGATDVIKFLHVRYPELLLQLDCDGKNILHYAADSRKRGVVEVVKYIISFVKDINPNGIVDGDAGYKILTSRMQECVELQKDQSVSEADRENILQAVIHERNSFADNSVTPLHIAVEAGNVDVVRFLLENKCCDLGIKNQQGFTALNMNTKFGTILHLAVKTRDQEFTKTLLSLDVDMNAKCSRGYTALDYAIRNRDRAIINLLLADPRQNIISGIGRAKVSYAKILKYRNLLDDNGKIILLSRSSWRKKRLNGFLVVAACFALLSITVISIVARAGAILSFITGRQVSVSLETRVIAVVAVMVLMTLVYVVFGAMYMLEEGKRRSNERAYFSDFYSGGESRCIMHGRSSSSRGSHRGSSYYSSGGNSSNRSASCTDPCSGSTSSDNLMMGSVFIPKVSAGNYYTAVSDINYLADDSECEHMAEHAECRRRRRGADYEALVGLRKATPRRLREISVEQHTPTLCR